MKGKSTQKKLIIYDPRTNVSMETNYDYLQRLTGSSIETLASTKSRRRRIKSIGCYIIDDAVTVKERRELYIKELFPDEVWKAVDGSDATFLISNHGRFKRIYKSGKKFIMPFIRKQNEHLYVKVKFDGEYKQQKVAHLVIYHFSRPNKGGLSVRHKNGIKTDCFSGNLEYISKENLGKLTGAYSKSKPVIQLDIDTLEPIDEYRSAREAGRQTFMSYQAVLDNCNGKTKVAAGSYKFMFLDAYESGFGIIGNDESERLS